VGHWFRALVEPRKSLRRRLPFGRGEIDEFGDIKAAAEQTKILVQGTQGLDNIDALHAVEGLSRTPKHDGIEQHQRLIVTRGITPGAVAATHDSAELAKIPREEHDYLVCLSQFIRA